MACDEEEEDFSLKLSHVSAGASLGEPSTAIIRIIDNDPGVRFGQSDYWVSEESGMFTVWVERGSDVVTSPFTVNYASANGTAVAGVDFSAVSGVLSFAEGEQSQTITVPILNDGLREAEEDFSLTLSEVSAGASLGEPSTAMLRIVDNDPGAGFRVTNREVAEAGGTVDLTVVRGNDVDLGPMRVDYVLMDDTARTGMDYLAGEGRLEFGPGELEKSFTVSALPDSEWEGDELVRVVLTNHVGSGALSGTPESWVRILDDDPVSWELVQDFSEVVGLAGSGLG